MRKILYTMLLLTAFIASTAANAQGLDLSKVGDSIRLVGKNWLDNSARFGADSLACYKLQGALRTYDQSGVSPFLLTVKYLAAHEGKVEGFESGTMWDVNYGLYPVLAAINSYNRGWANVGHGKIDIDLMRAEASEMASVALKSSCVLPTSRNMMLVGLILHSNPQYQQTARNVLAFLRHRAKNGDAKAVELVAAWQQVAKTAGYYDNWFK